MDFLQMARQRYSCRKYKDDPVPEDVLLRVLEAGRVSPSAHNCQPYKVLAIRDPQNLEKVRKAGKIYTSPVVLVVCGIRDQAWENSFDGWRSTEVDATIITDHMMLAAADQGLDSLWICWFDHDVVKAELALPPELEPINILLLGYGAKEPKSPDRHGQQRKALSDIVEFM